MAITWQGSASSYRMAGGTGFDVLGCLWNPVGSGVTLRVRDIDIVQSSSSNSSTIRHVRVFRTATAPAGGGLMAGSGATRPRPPWRSSAPRRPPTVRTPR